MERLMLQLDQTLDNLWVKNTGCGYFFAIPRFIIGLQQDFLHQIESGTN